MEEISREVLKPHYSAFWDHFTGEYVKAKDRIAPPERYTKVWSYEGCENYIEYFQIVGNRCLVVAYTDYMINHVPLLLICDEAFKRKGIKWEEVLYMKFWLVPWWKFQKDISLSGLILDELKREPYEM